jgi:hypothetical protein
MDVFNGVIILINGVWAGIHADPVKFTELFRYNRRHGNFNIYTSIIWDTLTNIIRIYTDSGRIMRPLFINKSGSELEISGKDIEFIRTHIDIGHDYLICPRLVLAFLTDPEEIKRLKTEGLFERGGMIEYSYCDETI